MYKSVTPTENHQLGSDKISEILQGVTSDKEVIERLSNASIRRITQIPDSPLIRVDFINRPYLEYINLGGVLIPKTYSRGEGVYKWFLTGETDKCKVNVMKKHTFKNRLESQTLILQPDEGLQVWSAMPSKHLLKLKGDQLAMWVVDITMFLPSELSWQQLVGLTLGDELLQEPSR